MMETPLDALIHLADILAKLKLTARLHGWNGMKTERELFEAEIKKTNSNIVFWLNTWCEDMQGYNHPVMCWMWYIWQASASRDGYKLVPVNPTDDMVGKAQEETPHFHHGDAWYGTEEISESQAIACYKAMINEI